MSHKAFRKDTFDALPVIGPLTVSAEVFIRMARETPDEIDTVRFVPPRIGGRDFGHFEVETRTPRFEVSHS